MIVTRRKRHNQNIRASPSHAQSHAQGPAQVPGRDAGYGPARIHVGTTDPYTDRRPGPAQDPYERSYQGTLSLPERVHPSDQMELELG